MPRQRRSQFGLGLLLLAHKLSTQTLPPVTFLAIIGQSLLFLGIINPPWDKNDVCISGEYILYYKDYRRLVLSAIEHSTDMHLYHNMASLMLKGRSLERRYGSLKFGILLVLFTLATSVTYVGLMWGASEYFEDYSYMRQCAIGFSGVLFALKVLTTHNEDSAYSYVYGIGIPTKYTVWAELVIIHLLVPRASFVGHLAGILVGLAYIKSPLGSLMNAVVNAVAGSVSHGRSYTYAHGTAQRRYDEGEASYGRSNTYTHGSTQGRYDEGESSAPRRQNYGWNVGGEEYTQPSAPPFESESSRHQDPDIDELRQRRMQHFH